MAIDPRAPRLADLIYADNAYSKIAQGLLEEIAKIGEASVRRIYGDFSGPSLKSWADILSTHAISPAREGRNPATGAAMQIAASKKQTFQKKDRQGDAEAKEAGSVTLKEWARSLKRDVVALWLAARDPAPRRLLKCFPTL